MTDARFPERWLSDRRLLRLSDVDFRTFVATLAWSVSNRTDGRLERDDLPLIIGAQLASAPRLVRAGLWSEQPDGAWLITDFAATQTSRNELTVLENNRRREREKKARQRAAAGGKDDALNGTVPSDAEGDVPRDGSPGTAQERPGRPGRTGSETQTSSSADNDDVSDAYVVDTAGTWDDVTVAQPGRKQPFSDWAAAGYET